MNFLDSLAISSSGLSAQRLRMNLISSNMANVNTTRTETGEPYRRKDVVFSSIESERFQTILDEQSTGPNGGVEVAGIIEGYHRGKGSDKTFNLVFSGVFRRAVPGRRG